MDLVDNFINDNDWCIKICTTDELIKIWLHELHISYSLTKYIFKGDERHLGKKLSCCYCKNKADIYLYNGYHSHVCSTKHRYDRLLNNFCNTCFNKALLFVTQNRLFVYQVIKNNNMLCHDVNNIIIGNFIEVTRYYKNVLGGFIDL